MQRNKYREDIINTIIVVVCIIVFIIVGYASDSCNNGSSGYESQTLQEQEKGYSGLLEPTISKDIDTNED
jgi:hypothetical protein